MRALAPLLLLFGLAGCGEEDGPYRAFLLLEDREGSRREFALGGRGSYDACGGLGAFEAAAFEHEIFWTDPAFTVGGFREAEDWLPFRVVGSERKVRVFSELG